LSNYNPYTAATAAQLRAMSETDRARLADLLKKATNKAV